MKKILTSTLSTFLISPVMAMSFSLNELPHFPVEKGTEIQKFITQYNVSRARPEHCPSKSESYGAILNQISTIQELFNDKCLSASQKQLDQILAGAADIEASLTSYNETVAEVDADAVADTDDLDGAKIAGVVNGLSNILTINSCSDLQENTTFLNKSATVLSEIAQIGLLTTTGNGLIVSAGGFALASVLRSIDNYLTPNFDFKDKESRQSYNKLNCAFYDLRRQIHTAGMLDIKTSLHEDRLTLAKKYLISVTSQIAEIEKQYSELAKEITLDKILKRDKNMKGLVELKEQLSKISNLISSNSQMTTNDKISLLGNMAYPAKFALDSFSHYSTMNIENKIPFLDLAFSNKLSNLRYDNFAGMQEVYNIETKEFFNDFIPEIQAHTNRILSLIESHQAKWIKAKQNNIIINGKSLEDYSKEVLANKNLQIKNLTKYQIELNSIIEKLTNITKTTRFTRTDDGDDNKQTILDNYNSIVAQIYGVNGLRYLDEMTERSLTESEDFSEQYEDFEHTFGPDIFDSNNELQEIQDNRLKQSICINATNLRLKWNNADTLAQMGYDFIATNIDLFADTKDSIDHLKNLESIDRVSKKRLNDKEEILFHKTSAYLANKLKKGESIPEAATEVLLNNEWLGQAMVEVNKKKTVADLLQIMIEKYRCSEVVEMD